MLAAFSRYDFHTLKMTKSETFSNLVRGPWKSLDFILVHLQTLSFHLFHFPGISMAISLKVYHLPNTNTRRLGQGEGGDLVNGFNFEMFAAFSRFVSPLHYIG